MTQAAKSQRKTATNNEQTIKKIGWLTQMHTISLAREEEEKIQPQTQMLTRRTNRSKYL